MEGKRGERKKGRERKRGRVEDGIRGGKVIEREGRRDRGGKKRMEEEGEDREGQGGGRRAESCRRGTKEPRQL